jgi:dihydroceramide fatty acyl 2-hydroxylase
MDAPGSPDLTAPLLGQVGGLGARYDAWIHRAIKPNGSLRIFQGDRLEAMSHIPWWLVLVVWVPITAAMALATLFVLHLPVLAFLATAGLGLVLWTLLEYALHRFIFHYRPRSSFGRRLHFLAHGIHHLDPWDRTRLVFPPLAALGIAVPIFLLLYAACLGLALAAPLARALAAMSGLLVGYIVYDMTHYYTHHGRPKSRWGKFLKAYHLTHHHKYPTRMFGVTQPVWDYVFGTGRPRAAAGAGRREA